MLVRLDLYTFLLIQHEFPEISVSCPSWHIAQHNVAHLLQSGVGLVHWMKTVRNLKRHLFGNEAARDTKGWFSMKGFLSLIKCWLHKEWNCRHSVFSVNCYGSRRTSFHCRKTNHLISITHALNPAVFVAHGTPQSNAIHVWFMGRIGPFLATWLCSPEAQGMSSFSNSKRNPLVILVCD